MLRIGTTDIEMMTSLTLISSLLLLNCAIGVSGFSNTFVSSGSASTRLHGIAEWRDLPSGMTFDGDDHDEADELLNYGASARRVPVVCTTPEQAVLQGEKKYFQFHSSDELRLFQRALDRNHGIFALGVIFKQDEDGDDVMMSKLQLMEIKDYNMNLGVDFGIFCTAQAVGRASLLSLLDKNLGSSDDESDTVEEPLIAICEERFEDQDPYYSMDDANEMAKSVLEVMSKLSDKEQDSIRSDSSNNHDVKILYDVNNDQEEDNSGQEETRADRFAHAYLEAFESDSNGYISSGPLKEGMLSWKEMNAISWAAFSAALIPYEDETMRLHAFDQTRITDRLKLASYWLSDIVAEVEQESNSR